MNNLEFEQHIKTIMKILNTEPDIFEFRYQQNMAIQLFNINELNRLCIQTDELLARATRLLVFDNRSYLND